MYELLFHQGNIEFVCTVMFKNIFGEGERVLVHILKLILLSNQSVELKTNTEKHEE